jgi:vancomycin resistance protein YoaR
MRNPVVATPGADLAPRSDALPRPAVVGLFVVGVLLAALAIPVLVAGGMGLLLQGRVMPRVEVTGVDIGLLTAAEAEARLVATLPDLTVGSLALTVDGTTTHIAYTDLGRDQDFAGLVAAAMAVGRSGDPWMDGQQRLASLVVGTAISDAVTVDQTALDRLVVTTATRAFARPRDAAVVVNADGTYAITLPQNGRHLHPEAIRAALVGALLTPTGDDVGVRLTSEAVPFSVTQRQAAEAAAAARAMWASPLALADGADRYSLAPAAIQAAIRFGTTADESYGVVLDQAVLGTALDELAATMHRAPQDASFAFDANGPTSVVAAVPGRDLNVAATLNAVTEALGRRGRGIATVSTALAGSFVQPGLTTAGAQEVLPKLIRLSTWTTYYVPAAGNGWGNNISIPAMDVDGMVILPGEDFDFWRDIGPVTFERGYSYGGAIIDGRSTGDQAIGGGICSTSTTLFNTALRAGLQMDARQNHYYYIDRYPMGLDATVFATDTFSQSMSFTNDTETPLIIKSYASPGVIRFDLWGMPINRVVSFSNPVITNPTYGHDTVEYTSSLPTGVSRRVEYIHNGFDVTVTRTVTDATTGEVILTDTYVSNYQTVNGVVLVGTG